MTKYAGACECAVCPGIGGGCHGYCGIPAWLLGCQRGDGDVILQSRCLMKRKTTMKRRKKRRRFSGAVHCPGAPCPTPPPGGPVRLLAESLGVRQHIAAPLPWPGEGSGWFLPDPSAPSGERCCEEEAMKKHRYGPLGGDRRSSALSWMNIHLFDLTETLDLEYFSVFQRDWAEPR